MFLEEKLDLLKRQLSNKDFAIRYTDYKAVMSKIEAKFLLFKSPNDRFNNWPERLKHFSKSNFSDSTFEYLKKKLTKKEQYWWVFIESPCYANSRHRLFEATLLGGESVSYLFSESPIFIIHKKYNWMIVLNRERKIIAESTI